jgi:hypothetical protein
MRAWGASVAAGYIVLGALATFVLGVPGAEWFFGLCAVATFGLSLAAAPLLRPRGDDGGDDGGGGTGGDDFPPGDPPWWPRFEREFREYADRRPRVPSA